MRQLTDAIVAAETAQARTPRLHVGHSRDIPLWHKLGNRTFFDSATVFDVLLLGDTIYVAYVNGGGDVVLKTTTSNAPLTFLAETSEVLSAFSVAAPTAIDIYWDGAVIFVSWLKGAEGLYWRSDTEAIDSIPGVISSHVNLAMVSSTEWWLLQNFGACAMIQRMDMTSGSLGYLPEVFPAAGTFPAGTMPFDVIRVGHKKILAIGPVGEGLRGAAIIWQNGITSPMHQLLPMDLIDTQSVFVPSKLTSDGNLFYCTGMLNRPMSIDTEVLSFSAVLTSSDGLNWALARWAYLPPENSPGALLQSGSYTLLLGPEIYISHRIPSWGGDRLAGRLGVIEATVEIPTAEGAATAGAVRIGSEYRVME